MAVLQNAGAFIIDPARMLVIVASILVSVGFLMAWKKYDKPWLVYAHLVFVLSPLFSVLLSVNCSLGMVQGLMAWCSLALAKAVLFVLPPMMALSFVAGTVVIPKLYRRSAKRFVSSIFSRVCKKTGVAAELFIIDSARLVAYATGKSVFISVGMFEQLSSKELEAVFLHELYHVCARSSWNKFSGAFVRMFSPVAWFAKGNVDVEEQKADAFAAQVQGTARFVKGAQEKMRRE